MDFSAIRFDFLTLRLTFPCVNFPKLRLYFLTLCFNFLTIRFNSQRFALTHHSPGPSPRWARGAFNSPI